VARVFTVRSSNINAGGIHCPFTIMRWRILIEDGSDVRELEVMIPSSTSPKEWLDQFGIVLEENALAERIA